MSPRADRPASRILKLERYRSMPWRNGRGSTLEIAREPATGEEFAWRLSLAAIEEDGDFSAYRGYRRALVLVEGKSLRLRFRGHGSCALGPTRRGTRFEGVWQTHAAVPQGRCTDLSLIVRAGAAARPTGVVRAPMILRVKSSRSAALTAGLHAAIFVLGGAVSIAGSPDARPRRLRARDTLLLSPGAARTLTIRNLGTEAAEVALLRWRPGV